MELEHSSEKFREFFLLAFTRELIRNSVPEEFLKIELERQVRKEDAKKEAKELMKQHKPNPLLNLQTTQGFKPLPKPYAIPRRLIIPRPKLPAHLTYLKPAPTPLEMNLGKLNKFLSDPSIQTIECNGEGEKIIIKVPNKRPTEVTLTKEEIDNVIAAFSDKSRIPADEGVFRAAVGRWMISAIISEVIGTKFIIKRIPYQNKNLPGMPLNPIPRNY